ncbi:hypothetical protein X975_21225, partial [Stegodyphus mimosarum]
MSSGKLDGSKRGVRNTRTALRMFYLKLRRKRTVTGPGLHLYNRWRISSA